MTDRELLELTAKAAGFALWPGDPWRDTAIGTGLLAANGTWVWNPLVHDGDALRLAVALGITIDTPVGGGWVYAGGNSCHSEPAGTDIVGATRRAIVRAAAEIGKALP